MRNHAHHEVFFDVGNAWIGRRIEAALLGNGGRLNVGKYAQNNDQGQHDADGCAVTQVGKQSGER